MLFYIFIIYQNDATVNTLEEFMGKFYLGIDIGTDSVGMACTDERYELLRSKGKNLWTVRLFDEAKSSSERKQNRAARRRLQRRNTRIELLQGIFAPFMSDNLFFIRLNNSGFHKDDKDENYSDIEFYKNYPTIFHLRKALINGEKLDLRHFYLAIHHVIKYRGHFLFENEGTISIRDLNKLFTDYNSTVDDLNADINLTLPIDKVDEFRKIILQNKGINDKKKKLTRVFNATNPEKKELLALLAGAKIKVSALFGEEFSEKYKNEKLTFKTLNSESFFQLSDIFYEEHFAVLEKAKAIYDFITFEKVLNGAENISTAMVSLYEKHKADLRLLKTFVKANCPQHIYNKIFRSCSETANYVNYIGYAKIKDNKKQVKKCKPEQFFEFLSKIVKEIVTDDVAAKQTIIRDVENGNFLPKILNSDNGIFPHQINGAELDAILKHLCAYYPEFNKKSNDGYTPAEKIKAIFTFRIPYYVGPLNPTHKNAWIVRKTKEKITPWNFNEVVDKTASNENFIRRMTNKCSYLHNQDVLPKGSMFYQAFNVLNQINKLTIGGAHISVELKQEIFNNLYLNNKKVSAKHIENYLIETGRTNKEELKAFPLGGFDEYVGLKANMNSYVTLHKRFGALVDTRPVVFENIILWHTLNTDKNNVKEIILQRYGNIPQINDNIEWLKSLTSFKEFGRLSKKLIYELNGGIDQATGEVYTVLNRLYNTNDNFNEIIFNESYDFENSISKENCGESAEIGYESVKELYVSPMVRRGIWQALKMVDEYVAAVGKVPDKIFVETTRRDDDKKHSVSRKNHLLQLYKGLGSDCYDLNRLLTELNHENASDSHLRQERLYLYFLQLGKCAYTGEPISLDDISSDLYDIDHIVPRSLTKDDGLDNKVLVKRIKNVQKSDAYPIPQGFTSCKPFWKMLKDKGFMSEKKYSRLTRVKPLSEDDFREFLNRQTVVTDQTVKAVAELLALKFKEYNTKIVYSKAKNVYDFKQKYKISKCRETNDLHHARDAYLNVVVGNVYDTKFTSAKDYYYRKPNDFWREYNLKTLFDQNIADTWDGQNDVARIKKIAEKTSMTVTRFSYVNTGKFYNETILKKGDGGIAVPRKERSPLNQTEKYGGFKSLTTAYFAIVKSKSKGKTIKTIEAIPVIVDYKSKNNPNAVTEFLLNSGLEQPEIIIPKLKIKSLVSINGFKAYLAGVTGNQILLHNACQWYTNSNIDFYVKNLAKYIELDKSGKISDAEKREEKIALAGNRNGVILYATKEENVNLYKNIITTLDKKAYQGLSSVKSFKEKLRDKQVAFESLSTYEQIKNLLQIIRFMKCNAETVDLTLLKDGAQCGKILINKNITNESFAIINQSVCGLTEQIRKV